MRTLPEALATVGWGLIYVLPSFFKLVLQGSLAKVCRKLPIYHSIAYPAASLHNSISQIRHAYTIFFRLSRNLYFGSPSFCINL